jgi:hypothetical protein
MDAGTARTARRLPVQQGAAAWNEILGPQAPPAALRACRQRGG